MPRILIVEDYPAIQTIYKAVLTRAGYSVTVAGDGKEALEVTASDQPDLILLDLLMAHVGGLEFLRLYNLADHPGTKVIVVSNLASPELAQEAKELGASRYLIKSRVSPKVLMAAVKETLAEKHA
jgi:CheY-like chemotaxis protein